MTLELNYLHTDIPSLFENIIESTTDKPLLASSINKIFYTKLEERRKEALAPCVDNAILSIKKMDTKWLVSKQDEGESLVDLFSRALNFTTNQKSWLNPAIKEKVLIQATYNGEAEMVQALLKHGPNTEVTMGRVMQWAITKRENSIANLLLEEGPISIDVVDAALKKAAGLGNHEIVSTLLASWDISDEARDIAVQWAAESGHSEIVELLSMENHF